LVNGNPKESLKPEEDHGFTEYTEDGKVISKWKIIYKGKTTEHEFKGSWKVNDGYLESILEEGENDLMPNGHVIPSCIISIDSEQLTEESSRGEIESRKRP
jgi:hypothetical protein